MLAVSGCAHHSANRTGDASEQERAKIETAAEDNLRTDVAPGGNFDLSRWQLQEPIGSPGNPTTIGPARLRGREGYQDPYFFTDSGDGAMTFWDPGNGVTTANSHFPRSELREVEADGKDASWAATGTHTLSATVVVTRVPDHVCIAQIHVGRPAKPGLPPTTKPLVEVYYAKDGEISLALQESPTGAQSKQRVGHVPIGTRFRFTLQRTGERAIVFTLDGAASTFTMPESFAGYGEYFKAGNYDQTASRDPKVGAMVKFYALRVEHAP